MKIHFLGISILLILSGAFEARAGIIVVDDDGGPGIDFTQMSQAFAAAQDGDVLLVKDGIYWGENFLELITIDAKSLTVIAEESASIQWLFYRIDIKNLGPDQRVLFRGFPEVGCSFVLQDNLGTVWFEDMTISGYPVGSDIGRFGAIEAYDCSSVVVTHCHIDGVYGTLFTESGSGVYGVNSDVAIYDSTVIGGSGDGASHGWDIPGGPGIFLNEGETLISGSSIVGGYGDDAAGGPGIVLYFTAPVCRVFDSTSRGGTGRPSGDAYVNVGQGAFEFLSGTARHYQITSPERYSGTTTIRFEGVWGDTVWFPHSLRTFSTYVPQWKGVLVTPFDLLVRVGTIPPSGLLEIDLPTPEILGLDHLVFFGQGLFVEPNLDITLSSPSAAVLLDSAF